jgi:hypothetical protein
METTKETSVFDWSILLDEFEQYGTETLKMLAPCELGGDPNHGVTELGFKLVMFGFFATRTKEFRVKSERHVEGGRIDVFVRHLESGSLLVIELKYVRLAFLDQTCKAITKTMGHVLVQKQFRLMNDVLLKEKWTTIEKLHKRDYFDKCLKLTSIEQIVLDALSQASRYADLLTRGQINPLAVIPSVIYYAVVIGVGSRVHCTKVYTMHTLLPTVTDK